MALAQDCLCLVCASELCGAVCDSFAFAEFAGDDAFGAEYLFQGIEGDKGFSRRVLFGGLLGVDAVSLPVHSPEIVLCVCDGHRLRGLFVLLFRVPILHGKAVFLKDKMDPVDLATTDVTLVNETTVIETTWVGLSCELFKMKLIMFLQFVLLIYVVFKLEKRLEKVEKRSTEKMPMQKV